MKHPWLIIVVLAGAAWYLFSTRQSRSKNSKGSSGRHTAYPASTGNNPWGRNGGTLPASVGGNVQTGH